VDVPQLPPRSPAEFRWKRLRRLAVLVTEQVLNKDDRRLELLHTNVRKYGMISNTVAAATTLSGRIVRKSHL
jgi:hypothetical protein